MKSKNERFNQQHKVYEQGRRNQIAQLISSLHSCLPRDHKPKKDRHTDTLSSVLTYVKHLQQRVDDVSVSVVQENIRDDLDKLKSYVVTLEERCDRYAKLLDLKGLEKRDVKSSAEKSNPQQHASASAGGHLLSGPVSVIAASAPLVFFVSQSSTKEPKSFVDAATSSLSLDDDGVSSASESAVRPTLAKAMQQDASTVTDKFIVVDASTETERGELNVQTMAVAVQVETINKIDRCCSPITVTSTIAQVASSEISKKRPAATVESTDSANDSSNKNKRRRSDETAPSILEIVNLVAANGTVEAGNAPAALVSNANGKRISGHAVEHGKPQASLLSVSSLLQQQNLQKDRGQSQNALSALSGTSGSHVQLPPPQSSAAISTTWYNFTAPDMGEFPFNNRASSQPRHSQHQASSQQQAQQSRGGDRHQQNAPPSYQTNEANRSNYSTLSDGTSTNCSKNPSRRGANFSVEFLHGSSGTNGSSERLQQHDGQSHHRSNQHRSHSNVAQSTPSSSSTGSSQTYRLDSQEQAPSSLANCGYYDLHQNYSASGSQWTTRDQSWSTEPSAYQWWTGQGTNTGFAQTNCSGSNASKTATTSSKQTPSGSQSSSSRNVHENQGTCINLSSSAFNASATPCSASTSITPLTATTTVWPSSSHSGYTSTNRFAYCAAPTFFPDPPNFSYTRQNSSSRKSLPVSTLAPVSTATISTTSHSSYSHYWASSDWASFPVNAGSTPNFGLDIANNQQQQHQNHGKLQSFQIATMFPEVSSSSSTAATGNWRPPDAYPQQQDHVQNDAPFAARMTSSSSTNNYTYRQTTTDSACTNLHRFL